MNDRLTAEMFAMMFSRLLCFFGPRTVALDNMYFAHKGVLMLKKRSKGNGNKQIRYRISGQYHDQDPARAMYPRTTMNFVSRKQRVIQSLHYLAEVDPEYIKLSNRSHNNAPQQPE
jgi:hypothetical protein